MRLTREMGETRLYYVGVHKVSLLSLPFLPHIFQYN